MKLIIHNIRLSPDEGMDGIRRAAAEKLKISEKEFTRFGIVKESVDARRKTAISLVYSVWVETAAKPAEHNGDIVVAADQPVERLIPGSRKLEGRPVIIGSGPAGLFTGIILAENGYRPLLLERGECVEKRGPIVRKYWEKGDLDLETNVQFGEGGAGTFSDGKLTTRIHDLRCDRVLEEFYRAGAHEEILYKARPHIGSDVLRTVVANLRRKIEGHGGEVRFNSKVTSLVLKNGRVAGVVVNGSEEIDGSVVVLAAGHSARDTYYRLLEQGISFVPKPFSIGVRIEHPQELINRAQFGPLAEHLKLGQADYQLFQRIGDRTVYSFCMCPGGVVTASASEPGTIVTNGMSEYARDRENANSALVVSVGPADFDGSHPLAGIEFQRKWERLAFDAGGRDHSAPVQRLEDFLRGEGSGRIGSVKPGYTGNVRPTDLHLCLPGFVTNPMKASIGYFERKLKGFGMGDALLTGVETRTSSPVRIPRGDTLEAIGTEGLYPAGEGAGYAGGIVSAATDGMRIAEQVVRTYARP